jgi:hypothetical protein
MRVKETARQSTCEDTKGGAVPSSASTRPRQTEDDADERDSEFSMRDSCRSYHSEASDDNHHHQLQSPYKSKFPSDINRISFQSENSDFCIETESPLEHDQVM